MTELEIFIDGASKGNPGPSGIGVVIMRAGATVKSISRYIGDGTNNAAEYAALIAALEEARKLKPDVVRVHSDSQLLCRQLQRVYKVRNPGIAVLFIKANELISSFKRVGIVNIPREKNAAADKLATAAVKRHYSMQAERGCPAGPGHSAGKAGRKVRAPEDSALCNSELSLFGNGSG